MFVLKILESGYKINVLQKDNNHIIIVKENNRCWMKKLQFILISGMKMTIYLPLNNLMVIKAPRAATSFASSNVVPKPTFTLRSYIFTSTINADVAGSGKKTLVDKKSEFFWRLIIHTFKNHTVIFYKMFFSSYFV